VTENFAAGRRRRGAALNVLGLALWLTSCTGTTGHLALATTRAVDLSAVDFSPRPVRHVVGRNCTHVVAVIPLGFPKFGDALEAALRQTGGQVLLNVVVGYEVFGVPFVYSLGCYVVEGDAA
jgi:hypothetical protein